MLKGRSGAWSRSEYLRIGHHHQRRRSLALLLPGASDLGAPAGVVQKVIAVDARALPHNALYAATRVGGNCSRFLGSPP